MWFLFLIFWQLTPYHCIDMHSQLAAEIIPGEVFTDHQTIRFAPKNPMGVLRQPTVPIILCRSYLEYEETFFLFT